MHDIVCSRLGESLHRYRVSMLQSQEYLFTSPYKAFMYKLLQEHVVVLAAVSDSATGCAAVKDPGGVIWQSGSHSSGYSKCSLDVE